YQLKDEKNQFYKLKENVPNPQFRYFINHSEIAFMEDSLEKIRELVKNDACDWIEGCYYTHAAIFKLESGYSPMPEVIEIYDIDNLDSPSKNWVLKKLHSESNNESYLYTNMKGKQVCFEDSFGIERNSLYFLNDFTLVGEEDREDEIIFVDSETGEDSFCFGTEFSNNDDELV
ncbi:MAG: hypothetical protein MJ188_08360, partial [Treponema sp.]|nr:hypothetical protein [Treponema sp.]